MVGGAWIINFTPEAERWLTRLSRRDANKIGSALAQLEQHGPGVGRPYVDHIKGSRHHNMKELRSAGGHLRALIAFDPRRQVIVLVGVDKTNDWHGWYRRNIRIADSRYDRHLRSLGKEGGWGRPGGRSADSSR